MKKEYRTFPTRATAAAGKIKLFIPFGKDSLPINGMFIERLEKGCFSRALTKNPDVISLHNHETGKVLGRQSNQTLTIEERADGLSAVVTPNLNTSFGKDSYESIRRGDIQGCSFGFSVNKKGEKWEQDGRELPLRRILEVDTLYELSPTVFPAYTQTSATARSQSAIGRRSRELVARMNDVLSKYHARQESGWSSPEDFIKSIVQAGEQQISVPTPEIWTSGRSGKRKRVLKDLDRLSRHVDIDRRLTRAPLGLGEDAPSEGGFLVPIQFSDKFIDVKSASYPIPGLCSKLRLTKSGKVNLPYLADAITVYLVDEAFEKTKSKPEFGSMEVNLHKIIGLCYATDELMNDYGLLSNYLFSHISEQIQAALQGYIITGTGAGMPLGILNSGALITEGRAGASAIATADVLDLWEHLWPQGKKRAIWLTNSQTTSSDLFAAAMGPVFDSPSMTLLGRPIYEISACPTIGNAGDLILMDPAGYAIIDRQIKQAISAHIRFIYNESAFRMVYRVDGQPLVDSPDTVNGIEVSPFVALDTNVT